MTTPHDYATALSTFVAQRSGIDYRNYGGSREAYMSDYRPMLQAGKDARAMLAYVSRSHTITPAMWADAMRGTRLEYDTATGRFEYTTGQYFVTEYRAAACRLLASLLFERARDENGRVDRDKLRTFARRELGRGIARRWFS
jgi:hypothetical protein